MVGLLKVLLICFGSQLLMNVALQVCSLPVGDVDWIMSNLYHLKLETNCEGTILWHIVRNWILDNLIHEKAFFACIQCSYLHQNNI